MKPSDIVLPWDRCEAWERFRECRVMLHLHGFLTDAENKNVYDRITSWVHNDEDATKGE